MVKLDKIYTRGGDGGETSLGGGARVAKHDPRVSAYGTVDEANAVLGLARLSADTDSDAMLARIQNDLFDLGADLCRPQKDMKESGEGEDDGALRISPAQIQRLEAEIDAMNEQLEPLASFVLPGGTETAAWLHLGRTTVRRCERLMTELAAVEAVNPAAIQYVNRLSDHLFVLARIANERGKKDVLWEPGANR
ncbi:MAG: cob(I)yrinic acid a,c-diamide adenosyltransferase [Rhodospirillales bacterium]|nr:cob(I)yrinic acid a,c-diamide adenosyltransferase [Alphaproteobacteria bacterium]MBL6948078.1 cob(I)yrinic acid a,c-diamide adenosyltransferase [Rhodospirillales bacterium]